MGFELTTLVVIGTDGPFKYWNAIVLIYSVYCLLYADSTFTVGMLGMLFLYSSSIS